MLDRFNNLDSKWQTELKYALPSYVTNYPTYQQIHPSISAERSSRAIWLGLKVDSELESRAQRKLAKDGFQSQEDHDAAGDDCYLNSHLSPILFL